MKPQDLVILLKKITEKGQSLSIRGLAESLSMSTSSVSESLERSKTAQLVDRNKQRVKGLALQEFLIYGIKYVFPLELGRVIRGLPTYISASPIKEQLAGNADNYVWKYAQGNAKGQTVKPLYPTVPEAAMRDAELYELLVLVDTLRVVGRPREKEIAIKELTQRMKQYAENKQ